MSGQRWAVAVAEYTDLGLFAIKPGLRFWCHFAFFIEHMAERDPETSASKDQAPRKTARFILVDVTGDRRDRCKASQAPNHISSADVAGMENFLHRGKMPLHGWIVEAMRIGDDPDSKRPARCQRPAAPAVA